MAGRASLALIPFLGVALLVRVLTDDRSSPDSRHSGSLNLSAAIAVLFILLAIMMLLRRRRGLEVTVAAAVWLGVWSAVALHTNGVSTETLREGVREGSVLALGVIVYNARGAVSVPLAARLVQLLGIVPAVLALYQFASETGVNITGELRSNGTFAHPNSAAMFFAIAATVSLWCHLDNGRRRIDIVLSAIFAAALIVTFSLDGLLTLLAMLVFLGALHPGRSRAKIAPLVLAALVAFAYFATPLGGERIARESATSVASAESGEANTSLAWRLHKWKTLLPQWESSPIVGRGLGTTLTVVPAPGDDYSGKPPHNEYIRYLVETGVVGLVMLLGAAGAMLLALWRRRGDGAGSTFDSRAGATLAIVVVAGCLINSLADNTLINSPTCYAAALIVVAVLALPGTGVPHRRRTSG
jgi:O-antigen ligase